MLKERKEYYIKLIKESESLLEVCRKANIVPATGNYDTLKKIIHDEHIDISHFKRNSGKVYNKKICIQDFLSNKLPIASYKLKNKLLNGGYKEHKCERCGQTEWFGCPIPLELHHIDGNKQNNNIENLQLLCPNCHTMTNNYGGKNQKLNKQKKFCQRCGKEITGQNRIFCSKECRYPPKVKSITNKQNKNEETKRKNDKKIPLILESIKRTKCLQKTAKEFGVSTTAIRKLLMRRGYPGRINELISVI